MFRKLDANSGADIARTIERSDRVAPGKHPARGRLAARASVDAALADERAPPM